MHFLRQSTMRLGGKYVEREPGDEAEAGVSDIYIPPISQMNP